MSVLAHPENAELNDSGNFTAPSSAEVSLNTSAQGVLLSDIIEFSRRSVLASCNLDDLSVEDVYNQYLIPILKQEQIAYVDIVNKEKRSDQRRPLAKILIIYSCK
jgi:hypothetical protein